MITTIRADVPGAIARAGAFLLIAASAALGTINAANLGAHYGAAVAWAFAAMALGGELLKPVAIERAFAAGWRRPVQALACLVVAGVAIAYSLTAELAFSAGARGDLAATRKAAVQAASNADAAAKRAADELARLKPARPVAELEALVAGAKQVCRVDVSLQGRNTVCSKPPALLAELGRAKRRAELEAAIGQAQAPAGAVGEADPQAAAVVAYLAAAGVQAKADTVATWLHLLPVLLLEVGSAFGLLVAAGVAHRQPSPGMVARVLAALRAPATVAQPLPATVAEAQSAPATVATVATVASKSRPAARQPLPEHQAVLAALRKAARPLSNDELAAILGVHKGTASKRVKALGPMVRKVQVGRQVALSLAPAKAPIAPVTVLDVERRRRRALGPMARSA